MLMCVAIWSKMVLLACAEIQTSRGEGIDKPPMIRVVLDRFQTNVAWLSWPWIGIAESPRTWSSVAMRCDSATVRVNTIVLSPEQRSDTKWTRETSLSLWGRNQNACFKVATVWWIEDELEILTAFLESLCRGSNLLLWRVAENRNVAFRRQNLQDFI